MHIGQEVIQSVSYFDPKCVSAVRLDICDLSRRHIDGKALGRCADEAKRIPLESSEESYAGPQVKERCCPFAWSERLEGDILTSP